MKDWYRFTSEANREMLRFAICSLLVALLGIWIWQGLLPKWKRWKQRDALVQAEALSAKEDYRGALIALRKATAGAPGDPRIWRKAAELFSRLGSPESVAAHQNLARLEPADLSLRVALIAEALRFGDAVTAANSVVVLEKAGRDDPAFHRLAASVALALGRADKFEQHLSNLVRTNPDDAKTRFSLAALRLWSIDEEVGRGARAELAELVREPTVRVRAAIELLKFAAATRDPAKIDREVSDLLAAFEPNSGLLSRSIDRPGEPIGWSGLLGHLQRAAATQVEDVAVIARWMGGTGLGADAQRWVSSLPEEMQRAQPVIAATAELAARSDDLTTLRELLDAGAWGEIPSDSLSLAIAARVQRLRFGEPRSRATWDDAVASATKSVSGLKTLARLAGIWNDRAGSDEALQIIVDRFPGEIWACEALRISYSMQNETDKLWRLYQIWAPRAREQKSLQLSWITLGVLLNRSEPVQWKRADELLRDEGERPELETVIAVAGARWKAGRADEGLAALRMLPTEKRRDPRVIFWEAVIAASRGDHDTFDGLVAKLPTESLMREEQQLLAVMVAELNRRQRAADREAAKVAEQAAGALNDLTASPEDPK